MKARLWHWWAMGVLLVLALAAGARTEAGPPTDDQRVERIASQLRCPTCRGLSAADSDAPAARAMREEVKRRVAEGQTDVQILDYVVSRYGDDVRLAPRTEGVEGLVWILPVVAAGIGVAGLALAFRQWRARPGRTVSDADRALVDEALDG